MKETGTHKELKTIKRAVANFKTDLREKIKTTDDKSLSKTGASEINSAPKPKASIGGPFGNPYL
jgi:hypothetical protein